MVVNFDMPGKNGASLEKLVYCILYKTARQTVSLSKSSFRQNTSVTNGLTDTPNSQCNGQFADVHSNTKQYRLNLPV